MGLEGCQVQSRGIHRPVEEWMPVPEGRLRAVVEIVAFQNSQCKDIGDYTFPHIKPKSKHRNKVSTIIVAAHSSLTRSILARCKAHGVTVSNAVFFLYSLAWIRLGYLNVILLGFLPHLADQSMTDEDKKKALHSIFWFPAKCVREQSHKTLSGPFFIT